MTKTLVYCCLGLWVLQTVAMANAQDGGDGCDENRPRGGGSTGGGPNVGPQGTGDQSRVHGTNDDGQQKKGMPPAPQRPSGGGPDYVGDSGDNRDGNIGNGRQPGGSGWGWKQLILTEYIGRGDNPQKIQEALTRSRWYYTMESVNITMYSGYITVNATTNSRWFFLFILAQNNHETAPLILSLTGGPGRSALFSQFLETGPIGIDATGNRYYRKHTLQTEMNLLYVDAPSGAGFSVVNDEGYATRLEQVADHAERFFDQFSLLFPWSKRTPFYIIGGGHGGRTALLIASRAITKWPNFSGIIIGSTYLGLMIDVIDSTEFLFCSYMINEGQRHVMKMKLEEVRRLIAKQDYAGAYLLLFSVVSRNRYQQERTLFQNFTGYDNQASLTYNLEPEEFRQYRTYANSTDFRKLIHVGQRSFLDRNADIVLDKLLPRDFNRDFTYLLLQLINSRKRVLFYGGQLSTWLSAVNLGNYVEKVVNQSKLVSLGAQAPWYTKDRYGRDSIAGYVRSTGNFTFLVLSRGGHHAGFDESANYCEMIRRVVYGRTFVEMRYTVVTKVITKRVVVRE